jgi:predicted alpha/beta-fold hydrolase
MPGDVFRDPFLDAFGRWALGYVPYGGADYGEVATIAAAVGDGDEGVFYDAWVDYGDRKAQEALAAEAAGHRASASALYLQASCFYNCAYHPLYGAPVDPRLVAAYDKQLAALDSGLTLLDTPGRALRIPFEGAELAAYFLPAPGRAGTPGPLVVLTNGYDATMTDLYFASAVAASRRGYHVLMFDGPGQGAALYHDGLALRPDWEVVVAAVLDVAVGLPEVDPARIVLHGWSLGGYLAGRAATRESRLAALVLDPGQWDLAEAVRGFATRLGAPPDADLADLDDSVLQRMRSVIDADRALHWSIVQRGFWANGVDSLHDFLSRTAEFTFRDRAADIACPVLLTRAENDPLAASVPDIAAAIGSRATVIAFTAAEGAGDHCEMTNRSLLNQRVLDWLDDTLERTSGQAGEVV